MSPPSSDALRTLIRSQIRPFSSRASYPTGWAGNLTFAQIRDGCIPIATRLMKRYAMHSQDIPDALQRGFMVLWERLVDDPEHLADKELFDTACIVHSNCGKHYWDRHNRHINFEDMRLGQERDHPDEWLISGLEQGREERWAAWATAIDRRVDLEATLATLCQRYEGLPEPESRRHLVALYYLTTEITLKDAGLIVGLTYKYFAETYAKPVRADLTEAFAFLHDERPVPWTVKLERGHTEPAERVMARYTNQPHMRYALQTVLDGLTPQEARENSPYPHVRQLRHRARKALETAYASPSP